MRYKLSDIDNERYYQLPKSLFSFPKYRSLSCTAKVIYAMLKDRMNLSRIHKWVEKDGAIFLLFTGDQIGENLGLSKSAVSREMLELEKVGLIDRVRQGQGLPSKIYIHKVETPEAEEIHSDVFEEMEVPKEESDTAEAVGFQSCKYETQESQVRETEPLESQVRESRVSSMQLKGCIDETPELQICNSRVANMQPNETIYSETENITDKVRLKRSHEEEDTRARANYPWDSETVDNSVQISFPEILTAYKENVSPIIGGVVKDSLRRLFDKHGAAWLMESIREAVRHNHLSIAYIEQTVENWKKYGYKIRPENPKIARGIKNTDKDGSSSVFSDVTEIMDELRLRQGRGAV